MDVVKILIRIKDKHIIHRECLYFTKMNIIYTVSVYIYVLYIMYCILCIVYYVLYTMYMYMLWYRRFVRDGKIN